MTAPDTAQVAREHQGLRVAGGWLREIAIVVIGALIASTLLRLFVAQMFVIPSGSMENTLQVRDRVAAVSYTHLDVYKRQAQRRDLDR